MAHFVTRAGFLKLIASLALLVALALPGACNEEQADDGLVRVTIKGETFRLEPALDDPTRNKGLGGRESIDEHGGMIFVFQRASRQAFYMKDCLTDIDIAFLDDSGRVTAIHTMPKEELQREGETELQYALRLKRYPSRFPSSVAIELRAGKFADLGLKEGDVIDLDIKGLKARAE